MELVTPAAAYLPGYVEALKQRWSPDNLRPAAADEALARIAEDESRFLAEQIDRDAKGPPIILPDGSTVQRLPGISLWLWDGEFCGAIGFRWQPGTSALPPYCLGHIGYSVVPWKRRRGYATRALQLMLPYARAEGLDYVELTVDADNVASQRVIEANGGRFVERFRKLAAHGGVESQRFRIMVRQPVTRLATDADIPELVRVINLAYRVEDFFIDGDRTDAGEIRDRLAKPHAAFIVAPAPDNPSSLMGAVYLEVRQGRGYFAMLSVDPSGQKRGLGRLLIDAVEAHCRDHGCQWLDIEVVNLREELPGFYAHLGFQADGTAPFPDPGKLRREAHLVLMSKPIDDSENTRA